MITRVAAVPRAHFQKWKPSYVIGGILMISITDLEDDIPIVEGVDKSKLLSLKFSDCHPTSALKLFLDGGVRAMTKEQGLEIFKFIRKWDNDELEHTLVVHCAAGKCRSGAVVEFARLFGCKLDEAEFARDNSHIIPNEWVLDTLCQIAIEEQDLLDNV